MLFFQDQLEKLESLFPSYFFVLSKVWRLRHFINFFCFMLKILFKLKYYKKNHFSVIMEFKTRNLLVFIFIEFTNYFILMHLKETKNLKMWEWKLKIIFSLVIFHLICLSLEFIFGDNISSNKIRFFMF